MKKRTTKASSRIKRVIKRKSLYFLIFVAGLLIQNTKSLADEFWIIENPSALVIYDVYEQRLTGTEKSDLSSFSAWHIIENNQTLSDQFTPVVKTVYDRKTYFFQSSTDGQLAGEAEAGKIEKIIHAQILNDTVRVIKNNRLSLKSGINRYPLAKGTVLHRIFQTKKKIYVLNLTDRVSGWVEGDSKKNWEVFQQDIKPLGFKTLSLGSELQKPDINGLVAISKERTAQTAKKLIFILQNKITRDEMIRTNFNIGLKNFSLNALGDYLKPMLHSL